MVSGNIFNSSRSSKLSVFFKCNDSWGVGHGRSTFGGRPTDIIDVMFCALVSWPIVGFVAFVWTAAGLLCWCRNENCRSDILGDEWEKKCTVIYWFIWKVYERNVSVPWRNSHRGSTIFRHGRRQTFRTKQFAIQCILSQATRSTHPIRYITYVRRTATRFDGRIISRSTLVTFYAIYMERVRWLWGGLVLKVCVCESVKWRGILKMYKPGTCIWRCHGRLVCIPRTNRYRHGRFYRFAYIPWTNCARRTCFHRCFQSITNMFGYVPWKKR